MSTIEIHGHVADGFEPVRDAFEKNFTEHGDIGAGVSAYVDGECVVDLTGGVADPETGRAYDDSTLQLVFSTTKGMTAMCAHLLAQRGQLDFDAPVASYWPEFAAEGKEKITVAELISHQAGVPVVDASLTMDDVIAVTPVVEAIAAQKPIWEPGTAHGYHAVTYGYLVGELVRRIDGRTIGQFFRDEIATPLGLDTWIGLPESEHSRVAALVPEPPGAGGMPQIPPGTEHLIKKLLDSVFDPNSTLNRAMTLGGALSMNADDQSMESAAMLSTEMPAANGITNARSLAKLYAAAVSEVDGIRLLDDETVARATTTATDGEDKTLIFPTRFGLGFFLHSGFSPLMGEGSFGHAGLGGSVGVASPERRIGFGYVMNMLTQNVSNDPRSRGLIEAVLDCA